MAMDVTASLLVATGDYLPDDPACPTHSLHIIPISAEHHAQYTTAMKDTQRSGGGRKRTLSLQGALLRLSHISPSPSHTEYPRSPLQAETPRSPLRDRAPSPLSADLLDDDPFAASPTTSPTCLYHDHDDTLANVHFPVAGPSTSPAAARPTLYSSSSAPNLSEIPGSPPRGRQLRPAASRPAVMPRPSLPSLNNLAHSDYVYPAIRARAGTLGARLPVDPWANEYTDISSESPVESTTFSTQTHNVDPTLDPLCAVQPCPQLIPDLSTSAEESQEIEFEPFAGPGSPHVSPVFSAFTSSDNEFLPTALVNDGASERTSQMFSAVYDVFMRFTSQSPSRSASPSPSSSRHASSPSRGSSESDREHASGAPLLSPSYSTESESSVYSVSIPASPSTSVYPFDACVHSPGSGASLTPTNTMYISDSLSLYQDEDDVFTPSSTGTARASDQCYKRRSSILSVASSSGHDLYEDSIEFEIDTETMEADGYSSSRSRGYSGGNSNPNGHGYINGASSSRGVNATLFRPSGGGAGGGGGDDPRRPYQPHSGPPADVNAELDSDDDDDKPLAQSIPGALRAQRTIRRQAREETAERHRQRSVRSTERSARGTAPSQLQPSLDTQARPEARTAPQTAVVRVGAQDIIAPAPVRRTRGRAATISGHSGPPQLPKPRAEDVMPDDLVRRLQGVQMAHHSAQPTPSAQHANHGYENVPGQTQHSSYRRPSADQDRRLHSRRGSWDEFGAQPVPPMPAPPAERTLRSQRSLHNLSAAPPAPSLSAPVAKVGRSNSLARSPRPRDASPVPPPIPAVSVGGASHKIRREPDEAQNGASLARNRSRRDPGEPQIGASVMRSKSRREQSEASELPPAYSAATQVSPPLRSRSVRRPRTADASAAPPVPTPVPQSQSREPAFQVTSRQGHEGHTPHLSQVENRLQAFQQRVFVFDMQRFHMVELGANTRAQDVLAALETQGVLDGWAGAGGWALCEIAQDLGMERPLRPFEIVQDVVKSWDKGRMNTVFLAKKCTLADALSARNLPSALPRRGAYVEYEVKRGSWKKRWLELREQGLWLAKKDTGKDETFLCSVSSFDAYALTRPIKSPKPFAFAVKSTDNLTFFENVADYVHIFSCGEGDGRQWIEKIMLARSYIMNQERNVIASAASQPLTPGLLAGGSGALKRSGTRKREVPAQPLIDVTPPAAVAAAMQAPVFEPGSLLARR